MAGSYIIGQGSLIVAWGYAARSSVELARKHECTSDKYHHHVAILLLCSVVQDREIINFLPNTAL